MVNSVDANTRLTEIKVGARQVLGGVYFEFNSARLLQESSIALDKLYQFLRENTSITMEVSGHTDNIGSPEVNKAISRQRAQAVVNYLVKKGIARRRLVAEGYGETQPIASNESALNGRDVNRRVEVTILSK
jgi:outer membrane protein OmpA-like peptidoglycan-associated protein